MHGSRRTAYERKEPGRTVVLLRKNGVLNDDFGEKAVICSECDVAKLFKLSSEAFRTKY